MTFGCLCYIISCFQSQSLGDFTLARLHKHRCLQLLLLILGSGNPPAGRERKRSKKDRKLGHSIGREYQVAGKPGSRLLRPWRPTPYSSASLRHPTSRVPRVLCLEAGSPELRCQEFSCVGQEEGKELCRLSTVSTAASQGYSSERSRGVAGGVRSLLSAGSPGWIRITTPRLLLPA